MQAGRQETAAMVKVLLDVTCNSYSYSELLAVNTGVLPQQWQQHAAAMSKHSKQAAAVTGGRQIGIVKAN
jgi:hypothetical protein